MSLPALACDAGLEARARQTLGASGEALYRMVARALDRHSMAGGQLVDVGCGGAGLWRVVGQRFSSYTGLDVVRYDGFPGQGAFHRVDLDGDQWPLAAGSADVVAAIETIEHLENPW